MARNIYADRGRLTRFVLDSAWRRLRTRLIAHRWYPWRSRSVAVPSRLIFAPHDLRTGDPTRATEFYSGRFAFAGKAVLTDGASPFEVDPPSREWAEELMAFGWLRHMQAAGTSIARANARALVGDWITLRGHRAPVALTPEIAARRVINWLSQAPLILQDADPAFHRRFIRSLTSQVRYLKRVVPHVRDGRPRLDCALALAFASLCMADQARLIRFAQKRLSDELDRQVLADGGHVGRNPGLLTELLLDLLPLRQSYGARHLPPPPALLNAIDRMMPMLRFFRHGDGVFAHFNGMGPTPADWLATVTAYDDARGRPVSNAPYSGYQRMEAGGTVVIADTGAPPPIAFSHEAHAGCLSFELSSGRSRVVVNCGMPATGREKWRAVARQTAAHSTAVIEDASSCRFIAGGLLGRLCGSPVIEGPAELHVDRGERGGADVLRASHDGYVRRFDLVHQRSWRLSPDGLRLDGEDLFRIAQGETISPEHRDRYAIRFHLHPAVQPARAADGHTVILRLPDGDQWAFTAPDHLVSIEESIIFASSSGPRSTGQLVITGRAHIAARVPWAFMRMRAARV
ncbi:heparinase II/III family protein [Ancylobacter amanitiformis]|uniref:Heparinase superfamily protein n=1 Tax=Ancylobacter amanitiformis TaxID=217069 RepID=A0ABU0LP11_9HYPH|nr:heparinase II/III family protein [Ancylobacter amanitiformis]MDQ0510439.1 putative heparinase superfamily protein [Ancylobacter amanitiformis]